MEEELRCSSCKHLYNNPVLLPCGHALCLNCAVHHQQPASAAVAAAANPPSSSSAGDNAESIASETSQESDKLSVLSEADSGVVCCTSRPGSYVGTPSAGPGPPFAAAAAALALACPACHKPVYFDENGAHNLPRYRVMQRVVERYGASRNLTLKCQMCEAEPARDASVACEQCEVMYCEECRETCHPMRGPLAKHALGEPRRATSAAGGAGAGGSGGGPRDGRCAEHREEAVSMYCLVCKAGVCPLCLVDSRHNSHDVQAITVMCKAQKVTNASPVTRPRESPHFSLGRSTLFKH